MYEYKATVIKVVDGDTVKLKIDLGFCMNWETNCRLARINTDELKSLDSILKESAKSAKEYLEKCITIGEHVRIYSVSLDKYKRPIIELYKNNGKNVNEDMLTSGHAKHYLK